MQRNEGIVRELQFTQIEQYRGPHGGDYEEYGVTGL